MVTEKKKKQQKTLNSTKWYMRWTTVFLLTTLALIVLFAWSEREIETIQPSDNWSIGVKIEEGLPSDYRLIGQSTLPDNSGIAIAYVDSESLHITSYDWYGKALRTQTYKSDLGIPFSEIKVIKLTHTASELILYYSDRLILNRMFIDADTLDLEPYKTISVHSEQFDADGLVVAVGDDQVLEIYEDESRLATYEGYDNLRRISLSKTENMIITAFNAADGGRILTYEGGELKERFVMTVASQRTYGHFKDIYLNEGVLTLVSSVYDHLSPGAPTVLGVWQLEADTLDEISFKLFYHVRTSLDPVITHVEGNQVSYILGTQQTIDTANKGLSRYPQTKGGLFTNVSLFTREEDQLIENTRITLTRQYPVGYEVFEAPFGNVLTWADKVEGKSTILMAGNGPEWIAYANANFDVNYVELVAAALMSMGNTLFFGIVSLLISLSPYNYYILGAVVLALLFKRFAPFENQQKSTIVMLGMMLFVMALKTVVIVSPSSDYRLFAHIYPWLFGSSAMLLSVSITTTLISLLMLWLWKKQHPYYTNRFMQFSVYFGFELYLFLMTIMTFFVSALMKNNFMM